MGALINDTKMSKVETGNEKVRLIRAAACLCVLLTHLDDYIISSGILLKFTEFAAEAVRVFFILSGYLVCSSSELKSGNIKKYYKKRAKRILPVYYLVITGYLLLVILGIRKAPPDSSGLYWTRYYLLLSTSIPSDDIYWTNLGATWTISYFALFYFLAPLLYKYLNSWKKCLISIVPVLLLAALLLPDGVLEPAKGLYAFITGMLIFYAKKEKRICDTTLFFVVLGLIFNISGVAYPYGDSFLLAIVVLHMLADEKDYHLGFLEYGVKWVDKHSYSIYLVHPFVMDVCGSMANRPYLYVLVVIVITMVVSTLLDEMINRMVYMMKC